MTVEALTPVQARVLGTLMEKARTVPDTYPLSLNLVLSGCNQKSSREPVMQLSEAEAQQALDVLQAQQLVTVSQGGRVPRYAHRVQQRLGVPEQSAVLLGLLMLRGPQTAGELRLNAERWYRFADISSVEGFLHELAERPEDKGGSLAVLLPRAAGAREPRWMHLLCGPVDVDSLAAARPGTVVASDLEARVQQLERELAGLKAVLGRLCDELGLDALALLTEAHAQAAGSTPDESPSEGPDAHHGTPELSPA